MFEDHRGGVEEVLSFVSFHAFAGIVVPFAVLALLTFVTWANQESPGS